MCVRCPAGTVLAGSYSKFCGTMAQKRSLGRTLEVTTFSSFPPKGFSAGLCPFEVLKRKKFVMATPPKLFDGIP